ncbi:hypothetical protein ACRC71_002056 [Klebsiella pneumoniae]
MRIFIKYSFMSLLFLEAASLQICYASDNSVSSVNSDTNSMTFSEIFSRQEQQRVDEEYTKISKIIYLILRGAKFFQVMNIGW